MLFHLKVMGATQLLLSLLHIVFPKRFEWKRDLAQLKPINRQIFYVHCFFICLVLCLTGGLCLFRPEVLLAGGEMSRLYCFGLSFFWGFRLLVQFFGYDKQLWKGKPLETFVHYVFSGLWVYYTGVYLVVGMSLS